jgi:hypothetical protein
MPTPTGSNRKWKIALVAVLVTAPLLGAVGGAWAAQTFPDVPPNHTFYKEVEWGAAHNIINGDTNGKFGPNDNVTRGASAAFLSHYNDAIHTVTSQFDPGSGLSFQRAATCPVGQRAIGGAGFQSEQDLFITDTILSGRQFSVRWETENNVQIDPTVLTVTAVCAPDSVANPVAGADASIPAKLDE